MEYEARETAVVEGDVGEKLENVEKSERFGEGLQTKS